MSSSTASTTAARPNRHGSTRNNPNNKKVSPTGPDTTAPKRNGGGNSKSWGAQHHNVNVAGSSVNNTNSNQGSGSDTGSLNPKGPSIQQSRQNGPHGFQANESDASVKHMHDRLTYLLAKSIGSNTIVTVSSGARYKGIFSAATTDGELGVVLSLAQKFSSAPGEDESISSDTPESYDKLVIPSKELVDIFIESPVLTVDKSSGSFRTDTDISGAKPIVERELQPWKPETTDLDVSLDDLALNSSSSQDKNWDQFAVNEQKFGVQSTYDEHYYTTVIDKSHPDFEQRAKRAEKIANEITTSSHGGNVHLAEERGVAIDDSGLDEEDKYSGVDRRPVVPVPIAIPITSSRANKYTPPSLRPPTGIKNSNGVPYDPAIISSALATPDGRLTPRTVGIDAGPNSSRLSPAPPPPSSAKRASVSGSSSIANFIASATAEKSKNSALPHPEGNDDSNRPSATNTVAVTLPPSKGPANVSAVGAKNTGIESELAGNFRQFVSVEVERLNQKKQYLQKKEKDHRLTDFKKFSKDYKIKAPVPPDLVPILAKAKEKQEEIIQRSASSTSSSPITKNSSVVPQSSGSGTSSPSIDNDALTSRLLRSSIDASTAAVPTPLNPNVSTLDTKSAPTPPPTSSTKTQIKSTNASTATSTPTSTSSSIATSTTSSAVGTSNPPSAPAPKKFNLNFKAPEFRPNPSAHSFTPSFIPATTTAASSSPVPSSQAQPTSTTSTPPFQASPSSANQKPVSRNPTPAMFFGPNKVLTPKTSKKILSDKFNPFLRAKHDHDASGQSPEAFAIEKAFVTPPTWLGAIDKSYVEMLPAIDIYGGAGGDIRPYYIGGPSPRGSIAMTPTSPAALAANIVPVIQPGYEDPNLRGMMPTSPPTLAGGFIPNLGYPYGAPQYNPQYYGRPGIPQQFISNPNMMNQNFPMGYLPQQGYPSPRGTPQAMLSGPVGQAAYAQMSGFQYAAPPQFVRNSASPQGGPAPGNGFPRYEADSPTPPGTVQPEPEPPIS